MVCYTNMQAYYDAETGKPTFDIKKAARTIHKCGNRYGLLPRLYPLPCGRCLGCQLDYSRDWAVRVMCEAGYYDQSSFLTLTYAPEFLPENGSIVYAHFQDFMKRLRIGLVRRFGSDALVRYFGCSEYGEQLFRPHFHACLLGTAFLFDRVPVKRTSSGAILYMSPFLTECWERGHVWIGDLNFKSAAYVSRYVTKKVYNSQEKVDHYQEKVPESVFMSRMPGLGARFLNEYIDTIYPNDFFVMRDGDATRKFPPPRYFDKQLEKIDADFYADVKALRQERMLERMKTNPEDFDPEVLLYRLEVKKIQFARLKREYESAMYVD